MTRLTLTDVLSAVDDFGRASAGLIGWEYSSDVAAAAPAIAHAVEHGLLRACGPDTETGELNYQLTAHGRAWLRHRAGSAA